MQRFPLVASYVNRNANPLDFLTRSQRFVNCFPEFVDNDAAKTRTVYLVKRVGSGVIAAASAGYAANPGNTIWSGYSDGSLPWVTSYYNTSTATLEFFRGPNSVGGGSVTSLGTVTVTKRCISITETIISGTANLVFHVYDGGASRAYYFPEGGALTQISDADFPGNNSLPCVGDFVHLDGFAFIMTRSGRIYNSDINSISAWTASNYLPADSSPDMGCGLAKYNDVIVAFGDRGTDFYRNEGKPVGSPLSRIQNVSLKVGCLSPDISATGAASERRRILNAGDTVYWIGVDRESAKKGIYRLNGLKEEKVSTPAIDRLLANETSSNIGIVGTLNMYGMSHILLDLDDAAQQPVYCMDNGQWWFMEQTAQFVASIGNFGASGTSIYFANPTTPVYQDNGTNYTLMAQIGPFDFGNDKLKIWHQLNLISDVQTTSGNITVLYSDDDAQNFSTWGTVDPSSQPCRLNLGGSARRRWLRLTEAVNRPFRAQALEIDVTECAA